MESLAPVTKSAEEKTFSFCKELRSAALQLPPWNIFGEKKIVLKIPFLGPPLALFCLLRKKLDS